MSDTSANPFALRTVLALVVFGALAFVALLWMIGAGLTGSAVNNGGGHAGGTGLNGFAGFSRLLEHRGIEVVQARNPALLDEPGLLVLTPPAQAKGEELARIVDRRRAIGPTLVVAPKWFAMPAGAQQAKGKRGWVALLGPLPPQWEGFYDDVAVNVGKAPAKVGRHWAASGLNGVLPSPDTVETGSGAKLVPLVVTADERILAAYHQDDGYYPGLAELAPPGAIDRGGDDEDLYPVIMVFEPDLLDNYGMGHRENAALAAMLVDAALGESPRRVTFDLTLNGLGRTANLLTLAFTPPYLAATLCLLLAALAAGWRAFLRFGPARRQGRAIAFGKRALVAASAGLIRRTRRLHLVTRPYADRARERIAMALGLPRQPTPEATEQAIDKALACRPAPGETFGQLAQRLRAAHQPAAILRAAQAIHALERTIKR